MKGVWAVGYLICVPFYCFYMKIWQLCLGFFLSNLYCLRCIQLWSANSFAFRRCPYQDMMLKIITLWQMIYIQFLKHQSWHQNVFASREETFSGELFCIHDQHGHVKKVRLECKIMPKLGTSCTMWALRLVRCETAFPLPKYLSFVFVTLNLRKDLLNLATGVLIWQWYWASEGPCFSLATRAVSVAYFIRVNASSLYLTSFVYSENKTDNRTQPWGTPVSRTVSFHAVFPL